MKVNVNGRQSRKICCTLSALVKSVDVVSVSSPLPYLHKRYQSNYRSHNATKIVANYGIIAAN